MVRPSISTQHASCADVKSDLMLTTGASARRISDHLQALACGSRSIKTVVCPASVDATDKWTASVVLPVPPFRLNMAKVFIESSINECMNSIQHEFVLRCLHVSTASCIGVVMHICCCACMLAFMENKRSCGRWVTESLTHTGASSKMRFMGILVSFFVSRM